MEKKSRSNFCESFCVIGFPDELGILNVKGRPGAKAGPASFIELFQKLNGRKPLLNRMKAPEMVNMGSNLEENYRKSREMVQAQWNQAFIVAIGGGHDYAYPWISGLVEGSKGNGRTKKWGCINIDAHFDLRNHLPVMTSGSPFRRLIDEKWLDGRNLVEFGIQEHCNSGELWEYAKQQKIKTVSMSELRNGKAVPRFKKALMDLRKTCDQIVISLDLDALSLAYCPGVSAPQAEGFTASELFQMLEIAGTDKKVTSLGVFELSPPLDIHQQTTRVAAQGVWHFLDRKFF